MEVRTREMKRGTNKGYEGRISFHLPFLYLPSSLLFVHPHISLVHTSLHLHCPYLTTDNGDEGKYEQGKCGDVRTREMKGGINKGDERRSEQRR